MNEEVIGDESDADGDQSLSNDDIYDQLANRRRRYALHYLKQTGGQVDVRELAEQVAAWENETSVDDLRSQERKRVYISLYQSHLSSMDEAGLVVYDEEESTVELADPLVDTQVYMEVVPERDLPWDLYYLGLSVANGLLLALVYLDVEPFTRVSNLGWALFIVLSFMLSAFVQLLERRRMQLGDDGPPPDLAND